MNKEQVEKRIAKLRKEIRRHRYLYHVKDTQEISDPALDSLKHELYDLEQKYPDLITPDSPTQRVSGQALDKFEKVEHSQPMLSLDDAFSFEEIKEWEERIKRVILNKAKRSAKARNDIDFFCEPKIDGLAVALVYKKGSLQTGATRGDGKVGEDVTQNLKTIKSIPLKLRKEVDCQVRGEVYMGKESFEKINKRRKKQGKKPYANPRNTAAGSIRQLDSKVARSRSLDFFAWQLLGLDCQNQAEEDKKLKELGFKSVEGKQCSNLKEIKAFFKNLEKRRQKLSFQIDGLVVSINNNQLFEDLGVVGKSPRGAIAWKFPAKQATTIVEDIQVQVGRTGSLTPVAHLKPANLAGVEITRATLHNQDEINRLDVRVGDTVIIERAGDVIPQVVRVLKRMRSGDEEKFSMPGRCPICGSKVVKKDAQHYCSNDRCGAIHRKKLYHFVSRSAFDIEGLGPKIIDQLLDENLTSNAADIFSLKKGDLLPLERFAEKSAQNLIEAVDESRKIPLARLIYALGIHHVGEETAVLLANVIASKTKDPTDFRKTAQNLSLKELEEIKDIGPVVAKSIYDWFHNRRNRALLKKLLKEVEIKNKELTIKNQKLGNKNFVLTGTLESLTREEAKQKIRQLGGDVSSSVSKNTDYVIVGEEPGSKFKEAKRLGVEILGEEEFLEKIE